MSEYNLGTASGRITIDGSAAEKGFEVVRAAAQTFFDQINDEVSRVKDLGANLQKSALVGAAGFGIAVKAASSFESRLSAVQAVSGATEDQMKAISAAALEIGGKTKFSATEAANAFEELVKAGISVDDALNGAADATAALAAAGEIALPRAAEIAASAMNNFNLTGKDMPRIADLIAGAANASAISVDEFASSLSQVGAVANLTGMSFDDTAVAIAEMGNAGIKGSDAGTSLKTMLMNLIPTTEKQVEEFQKLGLMSYDAAGAMEDMRAKGIEPLSDSYLDIRKAVSDYLEVTQGIPNDTKEMGKAVDEYLLKNGAMQNAFFDQEGNVKSLRDIQETLSDSTKNLTKEQKLQSLEILFGADAIRGAAVMADNGAAGYDKLAASMGKVTAADVSSTRMDNLAGDIEEFQGALETLLIRVGQVVTPIFRTIVQGASKVVDWFNELSDSTITLLTQMGLVGTVGAGIIGTFIQILAAAGPLLFIIIALRRVFAGFLVVKTALAGVTSLSGAFVALRAIAGTLLNTLFPFIPWVLRAVGLFKLLSGIFATVAAVLSGPVGIAIGILAGLVAIGTVLYNTWEPFKTLIDNLAGSISGVFNDAVLAAKDAWHGFIAGLADSGPIEQPMSAFETLGRGIREFLDSIQTGEVSTGGFIGVMQTLGAAVGEVWTALQQAGAVIGGAFMSAWAQVSGVFNSTLLPAIQNVGNVFMTQLLPALMDMSKTLWDALVPAVVGLWNALSPLVGVILQVVGAIVGGLFMALIGIATFLLGTVLPAIIQFAGPVLGFLISAIAAIAGFIIQYLITPFVNFIAFLVGTVIPAIFEFGSALITGIVDAFNKVVTFLGEVWTNISNFFSQLVNGATAAGDGAASGIGGFFTAVQGFFTSIWTAVTNFVAMIGAALANFFQPLVDGFNAVMTVVMPILAYFYQNFVTIFTAVAGVIGAFVTLILKLGAYLFQVFVFGLQQVMTFFQTIISTAFTAVSNFITTVMTAIQTTISNIWNAIVAVVSPIVAGLVTIVTAWWNNLVNNISTALNAIWQVVSAIWNAIVGFISPIVATIVNVVTNAWNRMMAVVGAIMSAIQARISAIWNAIVGFISPIVNRIVSIVTTAFNMARDQAIQITDGLRNGVQAGFDALMSFIGGVRDRITGFFSGAGTWLLNAGRQIIDGLVSGIQGALGGLQGMLEDITGMIPDWKGPPKRDKVLLEPAGEMIMQSLVNGFRHGIKDVYRTLNDLNTEIPLTMMTNGIPVNAYPVNATVDTQRLPVNATQIIKEESAPVPVAGDSTTINIEAVPTNHAAEVADTVNFALKKARRGGKYSGTKVGV